MKTLEPILPMYEPNGWGICLHHLTPSGNTSELCQTIYDKKWKHCSISFQDRETGSYGDGCAMKQHVVNNIISKYQTSKSVFAKFIFTCPQVTFILELCEMSLYFPIFPHLASGSLCFHSLMLFKPKNIYSFQLISQKNIFSLINSLKLKVGDLWSNQ